jgi:aminocarboxymuconate-semialdehyde decarboxylase
MNKDGKIDIHTHFIPRPFIDQVRRGQAIGGVTIRQEKGLERAVHPEGYRYQLFPKFWDVEAKLQDMDRLGIDISVLSVPPPLLFYWLDSGPVEEFCWQANEAVAEMVSQAGGRLYGLAAVPLQDPEAATAELRRAVLDLGLRGVEIGTRMEYIPLDDERFEPFFATAAELDVPVMLHPYHTGTPPEFADFYMKNLIGNPLETGVAATRLILSGCLERHPNLTIILVHGGGYMPYQIGRLDHGYRVRRETNAHLTAPPSSYLRRFYYDTITHAGVPLNFLIELVGPDRVVFGTDIPFDMADERFADILAAAELDESTLDAINQGNTSRILKLD